MRSENLEMINENLGSNSSLVTRRSSLLLEIGVEEIPARFLPAAVPMLQEKASSLLEENLIDHSEMKAYATPRRLALIIKGISRMQKDMVREVLGPPKKAGFDAQGNPTKAAAGFAASQGVHVSELRVKKTDRGEYLAAVIEQKGAPVKDILPEILNRLVFSLHFPKSMRWGYGSMRFARPIHWILALLDDETLSFDIEDIKSSNITRGHRFLSPGAFAIKDIQSYTHLMENNYVIVDQDKRKKVITDRLESLANSEDGVAMPDEELLETVTYLVEYPVPVLCEFPAGYLKLPKELLITVMKDHQKYFGVEDRSGSLKNNFIVISNTREDNSETVKIGAERVIKARFEDASFYYEEDIKTPLRKMVDDLRRVTFHDRLGSLYDKTERIVKISKFLSDKLCPDKSSDIETASWLCKTDLITGVVGEFPELQGLMGRYYALHSGEREAVANAIMEHYKPANSGDSVPHTDEGCIISVSDKIDSIASFFNIGLAPTGSEDPFALRRQTLGVIAILFEKGYDITLRGLVEKAGELCKDRRESLTDEVIDFFSQRIEQILLSKGYEQDIVQSVIGLSGSIPFTELAERTESVRKLTARSEYNKFLAAVKRINNIIPDSEIPPIRQPLLIEEHEKRLFDAVSAAVPAADRLRGEKRFYDALILMTGLTEPVNNFFDRVLVMDKREEIRLNRLAILKEIWTAVSAVADFSRLKER